MTIDVKNNPVLGIIIGLLCVAIGAGLLIFSVYNFKDYNEKNKTYIEIPAKVVDYEDTIDDDGQRLSAIVVEYTVDGKTYNKTSDNATTNPKAIGSEVMIKYNPKNPNQIIWANDVSNFVLPIVGGIFGLVGIGATIFSIIGLKKKVQGA